VPSVTARVELLTDIAAPIDVVYDLARDLDLHARSMVRTGERAIAGRTSGRIDVGETVTWRARHVGWWWTLTSIITVAERPTRFADEQVSGPFAWFRHEHRFEALDEGRTRMVDRWEHRSPFGPIGTVVDRVVLGRYMRRLLRQRNRVLRAEAEREAAG
jgi:ligand-binding SRPBCC domain-containing protein